ncbi:hypothetical protein E2493_07150 [Sphingomonas parva]|uniref:Nucleotidyltransferase family protein n=1 Tax=Sphingomonas parva TaxID=2555898 RepID=A0A4Y8ZWD9_9SPHN|nr:hypothetical protein [Sphingomonas parva]TFI59019.1 hypothetical protein E2493_07150 [Sphingomonas parva]
MAEMMRPAAEPWWLIGSAAMALHGARVTVEDVDLLIAPGDARKLFGDSVAPGRPSALFRSALFGCRDAAGLRLEVMAGLEVRRKGAWYPVRPQDREAVPLGDHLLFTPGRDGLIAMCRLFDRPKDRERAVLMH